jgi:hypothetical protein
MVTKILICLFVLIETRLARFFMTDEIFIQTCDAMLFLQALNIVSSWYEFSFRPIDLVNVTSAQIQTVLDLDHELAGKILRKIDHSNLTVFNIELSLRA